MSLKHGDRALCINSTFSPEQMAMIPNRPVKGSVYTIDLVLITRNGKGVTLVEIDNPPLVHPSNQGTFEPSFGIFRFKKVDDVPEEVIEKQLSEQV
jgi:hypothetical protein